MRELSLGHCHASAVCHHNNGVLIIGESGSGKTTLALGLMARGAKLIGDDAIDLQQGKDKIILASYASIQSLIEIGHIGIVSVEQADPTPLSLVVDLSRRAEKRLPENEFVMIGGICTPLIYGKNAPNLAYVVEMILDKGIEPV